MLKLAVIKLIQFYQLLTKHSAPRCRFVPSCSNFTKEAIETHGFFKGVLLGIIRLSKCHPFHAGGLDEVPAAGKKII